MLRKVSDIVRDLAVAFPQDQLLTIEKGRGAFSYIPWNVVVQTLDRIFGTFGWSAEPVSYTADAAHGVYLAAVKLTVSGVLDDGTVITVSRPGFGRGVAQGQGGSVSDNLQIHDTAASAAGSDALVKASKMLGDALGLYLYDKTAQRAAAPAQTRTAPAQGQARVYAAGSGHPTPKQQTYLVKAGCTAEEAAAMTFDQGKAILDRFFGEGIRADGTKDPDFGKRRAPAAVAAGNTGGDDIPF